MHRPPIGLFFGCAIAALALLTGCAQAPQSSTPDMSKDVFIVTHIDVMPNFANGANQAIQKYVADNRKETGAVSMEGLVQDGRPNHFTIVEVWQSRQDFELHSTQAHTKEFRDTLQPMLGAPFDERLHEPMP